MIIKHEFIHTDMDDRRQAAAKIHKHCLHKLQEFRAEPQQGVAQQTRAGGD